MRNRFAAYAWNRIYTIGLSREEAENLRPAMKVKNYGALLWSSALGATVLAALFTLSYFVPGIEKNRIVYLCFCAIFYALFFFARLVLSRRKEWALATMYVMLSVAFAFAIAIGTFLMPAAAATSFCVLLFALPLLLTDWPLRCNLLLVIATVCFCLCSAYCKPPEIVIQDLVNSISFMILSVAINFYIMKTKISEISSRGKIEQQRDTDGLTQLLNREAAEREIRGFLCARQGEGAFILLDVDDFKKINDTTGHASGDAVLRRLGSCLKMSFRSSDVLARLGGDEFIAFLTAEKLDRERIDLCVARLRSSIEEGFAAEGNGFPVTVSVGAALFPRDADNYETLYIQADQALYSAKKQGKNCLTYFMDMK